MEEKIDFIKFNCYDRETGEIFQCVVNRYSISDIHSVNNFEIKYWDSEKGESVHVKYVDCLVIDIRIGGGKTKIYYLAEDINNVIDILGAVACSN